MTLTRRSFALAATAAALAPRPARAAPEKIVAAVGQRGAWDTSIAAHAVEQGFFKAADLDVEIIWTQGSAEQVQAVVTGSAQIGIGIGTTGAIAAFKRNAPMRVVAAQMTGLPDVYLYVPANSPIKSMKDTDGKTVSYSRPGSSSHILVLDLARQAGVTPKWVSTGAAAATRTQVMSGQIDVAWAIPPSGLDLVQKGEARIVAKGADDVDLHGVTTRVNIAYLPYLQKNRPAVERFFQVYAKTIDWMYANPDLALPLYAKLNDTSMEVARLGLEFYPRSALVSAPVSRIEESLKQAVEFKIIDGPMPAEQAQKMLDLVVS